VKQLVQYIKVMAVLLLFMAVVQPHPIAAAGTDFNEDFNSASLDPAWQVMSYSFSGVRSHSITAPANHFDLTSNPGFLRYSLDPMTHNDSFWNGFVPMGPNQYNYTYDPGLVISRPLSGTYWNLEAKAQFNMPSSNGRSIGLNAYFGNGGVDTYEASFSRFGDIGTSIITMRLRHKTAPTLGANGEGVEFVEIVSVPSVPSEQYYFRLQRSGTTITAFWSTDGTTWNTAYTRDLGSAITGVAQNVAITGLSWFNPASSYGDFDYIHFKDTSGCYIGAPAAVNEGASFTATVQCNGVNNVYGFQLGTSASGAASTSAIGYTPGSFVTSAGSDYLETNNTLGAYVVSRRAPAAAASGSFTLGSLDFTASGGLSADGSAVLSLNTLLLGDLSGAPITAVLEGTTTVTILDLRTLNLTVSSDGSVQQVRNVTASANTETRGPQTGVGTSLTLNFTDAINTATPTLTVDMTSHLVCSGTITLPSSVSSRTVQLKAGDVVLNGADVSARINLYDAVTIGLAYGTAGTGEEDVNGDGTVNIFDLIHVGRNYGAVTGACP